MQPAGTFERHFTSRMLPVNLMSGFGITPPAGLQNDEAAAESQTTHRAKPSELAPKVVVDEVSCGL